MAWIVLLINRFNKTVFSFILCVPCLVKDPSHLIIKICYSSYLHIQCTWTDNKTLTEQCGMHSFPWCWCNHRLYTVGAITVQNGKLPCQK